MRLNNRSFFYFFILSLLLMSCGTQKESDKVNIEKQTIQLEGDLMTPEALWAISRIGGYQASPDGKHIAFQMGYYSVAENKSHQVLWMMNADGSEQKQLTTDAENETDVQWLDFPEVLWAHPFYQERVPAFNIYIYFPTQKRAKMRSMTAASTSRPVMAPR